MFWDDTGEMTLCQLEQEMTYSAVADDTDGTLVHRQSFGYPVAVRPESCGSCRIRCGPTRRREGVKWRLGCFGCFAVRVNDSSLVDITANVFKLLDKLE